MGGEGSIDRPASQPPPPDQPPRDFEAAVIGEGSVAREPLRTEAPQTAADIPELRSEVEAAVQDGPPSGRVDLRAELLDDLRNMGPNARYRDGASTEDRYFVQYFDATNPDASAKWWTPIERAQQHVTVDAYAAPGRPIIDPTADANEDLALSFDWQERSDYRIMKIPAGEQARYVESAAAPQHSEIDKRELPGRGPQIRLMDYDPHWEIRRDQIGAVYSPDPLNPDGSWVRDARFRYPRRNP